jgi:hypothetical protein
MYFVPPVIASFAAMTSALASFWCQTIKFTPLVPNNSNGNITIVSDPVQVGMWYRQETQWNTINGYLISRSVCVDYASQSDIDSPWKTARAFSIMSLVIGGLITVLLWLTPCLMSISLAHWQLCIVLLILVTLFQGLTFMIFQSDLCSDNSIALTGLPSQSQNLFEDECEWDDGTTANVISTVLWFLTALFMMYLKGPPSPPPVPTTTEVQHVTYEQSSLPEGGGTAVTKQAVVKGTAVLTTGPGATSTNGNATLKVVTE